MNRLTQLCARLGYEFTDIDLVRAALTHRSAGSAHNERLEFLGDALLDLVIADRLYRTCPEATEGDLSRLRASLVRRETLAGLAAELQLGECLTMGQGELRSGGFRRDSILADALEALLGAIYLDGGYRQARDVVVRLYADRLTQLPDPARLRDPKTRLQELLQARGLERPEYHLGAVDGADHAREFTVSCRVTAFGIDCEGRGSSRRRAEQRAARAALEAIENDVADRN